jgi:hypothetical protein
MEARRLPRGAEMKAIDAKCLGAQTRRIAGPGLRPGGCSRFSEGVRCLGPAGTTNTDCLRPAVKLSCDRKASVLVWIQSQLPSINRIVDALPLELPPAAP